MDRAASVFRTAIVAVACALIAVTADAATIWNGLTITNSTITNSNRFHVAGIADANEAMVRILGLRGTVTVADSLLQLGNAPLELLANAGALTMTVTNSAFQAYKENLTGGFQPTAGEHCVDVVVQGAATADIIARGENAGAIFRIVDGETLGLSIDETTTREDIELVWRIFAGRDAPFTVAALDASVSDALQDVTQSAQTLASSVKSTLTGPDCS